jgi:hypothetical protein
MSTSRAAVEFQVHPSTSRRRSFRSGGAVPFDSLNPGHQPRFDPRAPSRAFRRVVLVAPSLAFLLLLAMAGVASAADGLDLVKAAPVTPVVPSVDPKTTVAPIVELVAPVKDRVAATADRALPDGAANAVIATVRGAEDELGSSAPVPIPAVIPPEFYQGPDDVVQPRRAYPRAADADRSSGLPSAITLPLTPDQASSRGASQVPWFDGNLPIPMLQPASLPGPLDLSGTGSIGGSDTGPGPWLGHGGWAGLPSAWQPGLPLANAFTMPRGLTPRPLVPPG